MRDELQIVRRRRAVLQRMTHEALVGLVLQLEASLIARTNEVQALDDEQREIDGILAQLRCCRDRSCHLCARCVGQLFLRAKPTPITLPQKYVDHHRPTDCPMCQSPRALRAAG